MHVYIYIYIYIYIYMHNHCKEVNAWGGLLVFIKLVVINNSQ